MSCTKICSGDLRHKVDIIDRSLVGDGCNILFDVTSKATVRAKIEKLNTIGANSRLIFDDTNMSSEVTHKFIIRFRNDIDGDDLLQFDNRYFDIQGFNDPDERKKWLEIYCVERGDITNTRNQV